MRNYGGKGGGGEIELPLTPVKAMLQLLLQFPMWHILDSRSGLKMKMAQIEAEETTGASWRCSIFQH